MNVAEILRKAADEYLNDYFPTQYTGKSSYLCGAIMLAQGKQPHHTDQHTDPAVLWLKECCMEMSGSGFIFTTKPDFSLPAEEYMANKPHEFTDEESQQVRYCWANFCADL